MVSWMGGEPDFTQVTVCTIWASELVASSRVTWLSCHPVYYAQATETCERHGEAEARC